MSKLSKVVQEMKSASTKTNKARNNIANLGSWAHPKGAKSPKGKTRKGYK
jgi:hypothetical protein